MNPKLIPIILVIIILIMLKTGIYRPSRFWRLKRIDGKPTYCPKCGCPNTTTTMRGAIFDCLHHICNHCGHVWNS